MKAYYPEGYLQNAYENKLHMRSEQSLTEAYHNQDILESKAILCDAEHNLWVDLGCMKGMIPHFEGAIGIADGTVRDIAMISRVNKPVCFVITGFDTVGDEKIALLSRRIPQERCRADYLSKLLIGDVVKARITHLESFGAFADIGCGLPSLIPIDAISVSRISHPRDRFRPGMDIKAIVKSVEDNCRICLTHKELLGTWEENAKLFTQGSTVSGIIRSVEPYGIFVELSPNFTGLAEPREDVFAGQQASVYIKSLIPERMKVKLIIIDSFDADYYPPPPQYFYEEDHIGHWLYSPENCNKQIESCFDADSI